MREGSSQGFGRGGGGSRRLLAAGAAGRGGRRAGRAGIWLCQMIRTEKMRALRGDMPCYLVLVTFDFAHRATRLVSVGAVGHCRGMPLFRIVVWVFVLAICAIVLSLILNVLKALIIVGVAGLAIGVALGLKRMKRENKNIEGTGKPVIKARSERKG